MLVLSFDTCLNKTYLQLYDNNIGNIASHILLNCDEKYHSAFLLPKIAEILNENNKKMQDINLIAVNIGPGSFTGIRACLVIARTLAQQLDIKIAGFSSLQILSCLNNTDNNSLVLMDARKNKAYIGTYNSKNEPLGEVCCVELDRIEDIVNDKNYFIITDTKLNNYLLEKNIKSLNYENINNNLGEYLSKLALDYKASAINWNEIKPLYIQPPPVTLKK